MAAPPTHVTTNADRKYTLRCAVLFVASTYTYTYAYRDKSRIFEYSTIVSEIWQKERKTITCLNDGPLSNVDRKE